jgi:methionyl-tRNA synthetase
MTHEVWVTVGAVCLAALIGLGFVWLRMPVFRWSCRSCKRVVSTSRFRPARCACGENTLVASFCRNCGSWNTSPTPNRHCVACSSKELSLGAEYHFSTSRWRMRNRNPQRSYF